MPYYYYIDLERFDIAACIYESFAFCNTRGFGCDIYNVGGSLFAANSKEVRVLVDGS